MNTPTAYITGWAIVTDPVGLHARPAVKVTKLAKSFIADIEISGATQQKWVNAKSPSAVMKLKVAQGESMLIRANGADANVAVASLMALINRNFENISV